MRARIAVLALLALATTLVPAATANAGCGANVRWTDGSGYHVVGETKRLLAEIHDCGGGWVDDGPFHLYIAPGMKSENESVEGLRYLAPIEVLRRPSRFVVEVAVEYVVPSLSSGTHSLYACDAGCHVHFGDLSPQPVEVLESRLELRMLAEIGRSHDQLIERIRTSAASIAGELRRIDAAKVDASIIEGMHGRLGNLEQRVERLQADASAVRARAPWLMAAGAGATLLAGLLIAASALAIRRVRLRRELRKLLATDDVPAEVVPFELEPAD